MTMILTSQGMATWPVAKTSDSSRLGGTSCPVGTQVSADGEVHESRVQTSRNASTTNPTLVRSPIKALVMLVAFTLLLVSSPVRVPDEAEVSFQTVSDQLGAQRSSIHTGNYAHNISNSLDSDYDNLEESVAVLAPTGQIETHLARLTVYWPEQDDHFTKRRLSSSGVQLRDGQCAVDPKVIPYGRLVKL